MTPLSQSATPSTDTKTSLLDAAERLFAERGLTGASLRAITSAAQANLAAAHYHFGSKEALAREVIRRRLEPVNRRRLALLDALEAADEPPAAADLVRAFVRPVLEIGQDEVAWREHIAQLFGRSFTAPEATLRKLLREQLQGVMVRFQAAFAQALPELEIEERLWRFHFMIGAMAHIVSGSNRIAEMTGGICDMADPQRVLDLMVHFVGAGLAAPPLENNKQEGS